MNVRKTFLQSMFLWFGSTNKTAPKARTDVPKDYVFALTKNADARVNQRFLNSIDEEARLVVWLMIRNVRPADEVLIYSKDLSLPFYSVILRASCLLDSKPVFKVVLDDKEGIEVIKKLPEDVRRRIDCRLATTKDGSHILVTPVAFRAEAEKYRDELFVVCNFYEPDIAQKLRGRFERIWSNSVPCPTV